MAAVCAYCGASCGSPANLVRHMRAAHSSGDANASLAMNPEAGTPGFKCARCGAVFTTAPRLAAHGEQPRSEATGRPVSRTRRSTRLEPRGWPSP
jgi:hypothetical protein